MQLLRIHALSLSLLVFSSLPLSSLNAQDRVAANSATSASPATESAKPVPSVHQASLDEIMDRVVEREHSFVATMRSLHPIVETYLQSFKTDVGGETFPVNDQYFLGRLDVSDGPEDTAFVDQGKAGHRRASGLASLYSLRFSPRGFAQMVFLDTDFQKKNYSFTFAGEQFLGEVRCLMIDVEPKKDSGIGRFRGKIWVEDQNYNIVRFDGTYFPAPRNGFYLHFDSWRLNLRPGVWLPAYIYSEESDVKFRLSKTGQFRAQTRLWGYDTKTLNKDSEFTQIQVDSQEPVRDQSEAASDASPVMAERIWELQAEDNVIERLQKTGLLAPPSEVDKVLQTVANNLLVTNNIESPLGLRCRVLLTTPLESFTIGHTIVVSRGLLDVLPDEASLAMVISYELSHILLGHAIDTKLAFDDRMFFQDENSFKNLSFKHSLAQEQAAEAKALELLKTSPYKDKLASAGLFLKAVDRNAPALPNLLRPHLGNGVEQGKWIRMSALLSSSPELQTRSTEQIAALPLGGRVKLNPWNDELELAKLKPVALTSPREKMPFEVTPFFPYLSRFSAPASDRTAVNRKPD